MKTIKKTNNYWFTIEPYVFISIKNECVLLYNTLDGATIKSNNNIIIELLKEILLQENCGVILLSHEKYQQNDIKDFINELREKYMGDIIDISLSKKKPVQLLPYFNFPNKLEIYKRHNFSSLKNILQNLLEINIHIDSSIDVSKFISFLQTVPDNRTFNIIGNISKVNNYNELLTYFNQLESPKYLLCSYKDVFILPLGFENNFFYQISISFPINIEELNSSMQKLLNQTLSVEYVFGVTSEDEYLQAEQIVKQFQIDKYQLKPIYTGKNNMFFEKNVFLTEEDIFSTNTTIKDIFAHQAINIYDFGKINIMPNGDVYANMNYPKLGNIYKDSIYEIVYNEVEKGQSWFRIRNQKPCNDCIYQWLCPPPSNYEIAIGRPNLCHIK